MTAKEFLRRTTKISKEIDELENRIKETRASYMSPRAIQYDDMPKAHRPTDLSDYYARVEIYVNMLLEKEKELSDYYARVEIYVNMLLEKEKELIGTHADIVMTVDRIEDPDERRVLMLRYIDGKSWIAIAHAIPCSERAVYYIHGRALRHLEEILQSIAVNRGI